MTCPDFRVVRHSWEACSIVDSQGRTVATLKCWEDEGEEDISERALPLAERICAALQQPGGETYSVPALPVDEEAEARLDRQLAQSRKFTAEASKLGRKLRPDVIGGEKPEESEGEWHTDCPHCGGAVVTGQADEIYRARMEALEEAARLVEAFRDNPGSIVIAAAIRALAKR